MTISYFIFIFYILSVTILVMFKIYRSLRFAVQQIFSQEMNNEFLIVFIDGPRILEYLNK